MAAPQKALKKRDFTKTQPRRVQALIARKTALELRALGYNYKRIADTLGVAVSTARAMVVEEMDKIRGELKESAEELRQQSNMVLESYREECLKVVNGRGKPLTKRAFMETGIKTEERIAKLNGLDTPVIQKTESKLAVRIYKTSDGNTVDVANMWIPPKPSTNKLELEAPKENENAIPVEFTAVPDPVAANGTTGSGAGSD
jgi:hypothetical protein